MDTLDSSGQIGPMEYGSKDGQDRIVEDRNDHYKCDEGTT